METKKEYEKLNKSYENIDNAILCCQYLLKELKNKKKQSKEPKPETKNQLYYEKFKQKNAEKIKEKIQCPDCLGFYSYFGKHKHMQTKKHLFYKNKILKEITINNINE